MADRFISEKQLEEERASGIVPLRREAPKPAKPLYEQLKENQEKADAEWKEKFKFRGPRALDEDDVKFMDDQMQRREQEKIATEIEMQEELEKFEERARLTFTSDAMELFPVIIKKDDDDKKHKKPAGLSNLLGVQVKPAAAVSGKRKVEEAVVGKKGKDKVVDDQQSASKKKKVVMLTPLVATAKPAGKKAETKTTNTKKEKHNGDKEDQRHPAKVNVLEQYKKKDESGEKEEPEEEEEGGGGALLSLVDY